MQNLVQAETIKSAIRGDEQAFRILVEAYQGFTYSLAYRLLNSREDALDVVQETFIRLWRHLPKYREEIKLTTWLYKIVSNLCLDVMRTNKRKRSHHTSSVDEHLALINEVTTEQAIINEEFRLILQELSKVLTPKQQMIFVLRDLEGLEVNEVCDALSISPGNLKSNLYYAREKMNALVQHYYSERQKKAL